MVVKVQFIVGQWLSGSGVMMSKLVLEDQLLLWQVVSVGVDDVQVVCVVVCVVFYFWLYWLLVECIDVVQCFVVLLEMYKEVLVILIFCEISKLLWEICIEVQVMIGKVVIFIEVYYQWMGFYELMLLDGKVLLCYKLYGVMVVFGFYNFLGYLFNGYIILVLIVGNIIVFKFSELMLVIVEMIVQLWQQVGIFDGVINLLQGGKVIGQVLLENCDIDGVLFIGSVVVGFYFYCYFGGQLEKMLVFEMGGNNVLIVVDVVDIDVVLYVIIQLVFIFVGQCCICVCWLIVLCGEQGDVLLQWLVEVSVQICVGKWDDQLVLFMGGVIFFDVVQNMLVVQ